jgi:hypothetical protein
MRSPRSSRPDGSRRTALNDFYAHSTTAKRRGSAPKFVNRRGPAITRLRHRFGRPGAAASG